MNQGSTGEQRPWRLQEATPTQEKTPTRGAEARQQKRTEQQEGIIPENRQGKGFGVVNCVRVQVQDVLTKLEGRSYYFYCSFVRRVLKSSLFHIDSISLAFKCDWMLCCIYFKVHNESFAVCLLAGAAGIKWDLDLSGISTHIWNAKVSFGSATLLKFSLGQKEGKLLSEGSLLLICTADVHWRYSTSLGEQFYTPQIGFSSLGVQFITFVLTFPCLSSFFICLAVE